MNTYFTTNKLMNGYQKKKWRPADQLIRPLNKAQRATNMLATWATSMWTSKALIIGPDQPLTTWVSL